MENQNKKLEQNRSKLNRYAILFIFLISMGIFVSCSLTTPQWHFTFDEVESFSPEGTAMVTLEWDYNSEPDIAGYKLYYGSFSRGYGYVIDIGNLTTYTVEGLAEGETYFIAVTAYNTTDLESGYSNEVIYVVPFGS